MIPLLPAKTEVSDDSRGCANLDGKFLHAEGITGDEEKEAVLLKNNGRLLELAALMAMTLTVLVSVFAFRETCGEVRAAVLRLHVVANSDSPADQALKLKVRDAILRESGDLFAAAEDKARALRAAETALPAMEKTARRVVARQGVPYAVHVELGQSAFPTRTYGDVTLPAGVYDAVKVTLGSGAGHNWWCVMFPPLCLPAASDAPGAEDVLGETALALVRENPKLELRFWLVEQWEALRERWKRG